MGNVSRPGLVIAVKPHTAAAIRQMPQHPACLAAYEGTAGKIMPAADLTETAVPYYRPGPAPAWSWQRAADTLTPFRDVSWQRRQRQQAIQHAFASGSRNISAVGRFLSTMERMTSPLLEGLQGAGNTGDSMVLAIETGAICLHFGLPALACPWFEAAVDIVFASPERQLHMAAMGRAYEFLADSAWWMREQGNGDDTFRVLDAYCLADACYVGASEMAACARVQRKAVQALTQSITASMSGSESPLVRLLRETIEQEHGIALQLRVPVGLARVDAAWAASVAKFVAQHHGVGFVLGTDGQVSVVKAFISAADHEAFVPDGALVFSLGRWERSGVVWQCVLEDIVERLSQMIGPASLHVTLVPPSRHTVAESDREFPTHCRIFADRRNVSRHVHLYDDGAITCVRDGEEVWIGHWQDISPTLN